MSTVEIVNARPNIITIKDNTVVCSLRINVKKPKSGLIVESLIEKATIPENPIKKTIGMIIKKKL